MDEHTNCNTNVDNTYASTRYLEGSELIYRARPTQRKEIVPLDI
jgi:hypothetical protein